MPEINWSLARTPDFAGNAYAARAQGQADRLDATKRNAYALYAQDPDAGAKAIMAIDPQTGIALQDRQTALAATKRKQAYAAQAAGGDTAGAKTEALKAGDFDFLESLGKLDDRQKAEVHRQNEIGASVALSLQSLKTPQERAAQIQALAPKLKAQGFNDEQIAAIPTDDAGIVSSLALSQSVKDILEQKNADRTYAAGREDAAFNQGMEKDKFSHTVAKDNASLGIDRARLGFEGQRVAIARQSANGEQTARQVKLTEGQAKDGFSAKRIAAANRVMSRLESDPKFVATLSGVGASIGGDKSRQYTQARDEWSDSMIRLTTGAAATKEEIAAANRTYFPSPLDSKDVVKQKAEARRRIEADAITRAGPGAAGMSAPTESIATPAKRPPLSSFQQK